MEKPKGPYSPGKILKRVPKRKMTPNAKLLSKMRRRLSKPPYPKGS